MNWEKRAVDEETQLEARADEIEKELSKIEQRLSEGWLSDNGFSHFNQEFEELASELDDIRKLLKNE